MRARLSEEATAEVRRTAIRALVRGRRIGTQEELRALLAADGFEVTQGTLSRDLARLGARRGPLPEGGAVYELPGQAPARPSAHERLRELREMVLRIQDNGALVVVDTTPGTASAVALALDQVRLPEVLGTLAGDDTIFIAPAKASAAARLSRQLTVLFQKGSERT